MRKIPMRTCVITGERIAKKDLLRVVRTPEGEVKVDVGGKMNGHGAYLKKDLSILAKAKKSKALARALETDIPEPFWEILQRTIEHMSEGKG